MELSATCPDGWADRSMLVYSAPLPAPRSGVLPNVVVTRERFADDLPEPPVERIREFARRQVVDMEAKLREPRLIDRQLSRLKGREAAQVRVSWRTEQARVLQWVVFVTRSPEEVLILTATAAEGEFDGFEETFAQVIGSLELDP